jgi:hypothetical protein
VDNQVSGRIDTVQFAGLRGSLQCNSYELLLVQQSDTTVVLIRLDAQPVRLVLKMYRIQRQVESRSELQHIKHPSAVHEGELHERHDFSSGVVFERSDIV